MTSLSANHWGPHTCRWLKSQGGLGAVEREVGKEEDAEVNITGGRDGLGTLEGGNRWMGDEKKEFREIEREREIQSPRSF